MNANVQQGGEVKVDGAEKRAVALLHFDLERADPQVYSSIWKLPYLCRVSGSCAILPGENIAEAKALMLSLNNQGYRPIWAVIPAAPGQETAYLEMARAQAGRALREICATIRKKVDEATLKDTTPGRAKARIRDIETRLMLFGLTGGLDEAFKAANDAVKLADEAVNGDKRREREAIREAVKAAKKEAKDKLRAEKQAARDNKAREKQAVKDAKKAARESAKALKDAGATPQVIVRPENVVDVQEATETPVQTEPLTV